jgi:prepilin-type N-terminal cleavage/methylation domain-containing protein
MKYVIRGRAGFTLAEMILVVSILTILLAVSTPSLFGFIQQRDIQQEENVLQDLRRALQAYIADKNALPRLDDPATPAVEWAEDLAGYTNLSVVQIARDQWDNPRSFIRYVDTSRNIQGASVSVNYATIMSAGPDRQVEAITNRIPVQSTSMGPVFAAPADTGWWANQSTPTNLQASIAAFGSLATAGDDLMVKFTDYPEKLDLYNLTLQRMDRLANALESIARVRYGEMVGYCAGLPRNTNGLTGNTSCDTPGEIERIVYYPIGVPSNTSGWDETFHTYHFIYTGASAPPTADQVRVRNAQGDTVRRGDMVKLVRMLGLPDDFCCSALERGTDSEPKPFFYFSNPRPRGVSGGCGTRPGLSDQKLPARLATVNDDSASPPTCG